MCSHTAFALKPAALVLIRPHYTDIHSSSLSSSLKRCSESFPLLQLGLSFLSAKRINTLKLPHAFPVERRTYSLFRLPIQPLTVDVWQYDQQLTPQAPSSTFLTVPHARCSLRTRSKRLPYHGAPRRTPAPLSESQGLPGAHSTAPLSPRPPTRRSRRRPPQPRGTDTGNASLPVQNPSRQLPPPRQRPVRFRALLPKLGREGRVQRRFVVALHLHSSAPRAVAASGHLTALLPLPLTWPRTARLLESHARAQSWCLAPPFPQQPRARPADGDTELPLGTASGKRRVPCSSCGDELSRCSPLLVLKLLRIFLEGPRCVLSALKYEFVAQRL